MWRKRGRVGGRRQSPKDAINDAHIGLCNSVPATARSGVDSGYVVHRQRRPFTTAIGDDENDIIDCAFTLSTNSMNFFSFLSSAQRIKSTFSVSGTAISDLSLRLLNNISSNV